MERVNLYSDTQTRPSAEMRRRMAAAEVGDEQRLQDPTVTELQQRVARLLGLEAGLFLPTGTMCNQIAIRVHTRPGGDELICHSTAHPAALEAGGPAALSGVMVRAVDGVGGIFDAAALEQALRPTGSRYAPRSRLVTIEQTTNLGGGRIWPLETISGVLAAARGHGMRTHLDGARLLNASAATAVAPDTYAQKFDTAWIDFSKGLGAPVGAVLCGSRELIEEAWRYKQMLGGAMRQAGVLAAACLYALENNVDRLPVDHDNARLLAGGLAQIKGVHCDPDAVETNIVLYKVGNGAAVLYELGRRGIEASQVDKRTLRMVTHLDVDRAGIERAIAGVRDAVAAAG